MRGRDTDHTTDETDGKLHDPIATVVLSGTAYDRVRLLRPGALTRSLPRTLALQSGLLVVLAAVLALSEPLQRLASEGAPMGASPGAILFCTVGLLAVIGSGTGLSVVGVARLRAEPNLTESMAERLVGVEEGATLLGLGTGGLTVLLAGVRVAAVHFGVEVSTTVTDPVVPVPEVPVLGAVAFAAGLALLVLSRFLGSEWSRVGP